MQSDTKMPLIATRNIRLCQLRKSSNGKKEFFFSSRIYIMFEEILGAHQRNHTQLKMNMFAESSAVFFFYSPYHFLLALNLFFSFIVIFVLLHSILSSLLLRRSQCGRNHAKPCLYVDIWCALHRFCIASFFFLFCFDAFSFMHAEMKRQKSNFGILLKISFLYSIFSLFKIKF